VKQAPHKLFK